jgi:hypothetical protein
MISRHTVKSATGNFLNGRPHELARITTDDNVTVIGNFKNGFMHGFFRMWDAGKNMKSLIKCHGSFCSKIEG